MSVSIKHRPVASSTIYCVLYDVPPEWDGLMYWATLDMAITIAWKFEILLDILENLV